MRISRGERLEMVCIWPLGGLGRNIKRRFGRHCEVKRGGKLQLNGVKSGVIVPHSQIKLPIYVSIVTSRSIVAETQYRKRGTSNLAPAI